MPSSASRVDISLNGDVIFATKCTEDVAHLDPDCASTPFEIIETFVIDIYMDDGYLGTPDEQFVRLPVTVIIQDPCAGNQIALMDTLSYIEFPLTEPGSEFLYQPIMSSMIEVCQVACRLVTLPDSGPYPSNIVRSFSPQSLQILIATTNKSLYGQTLSLSIQCKSVASSHPDSYAQNDLDILFIDECAESNLSPPTIDSFDVPLGTQVAVNFNLSYNDKDGCAPISYTLLAPLDPAAPAFSINEYG